MLDDETVLYCLFGFLKVSLSVCLRERKREYGVQAQREGQRESLVGSVLSAQSLMPGLNHKIMT